MRTSANVVRRLAVFLPVLLAVGSCKDSTPPPPAAGLSITTEPSASTQNGVAFAVQPAVQLVDASGKPAKGAGIVITANVAVGNPELGGTLTATTNAAGLATFTDLKITGVIGNRALEFTATGLESATSESFAITAGAPSKLAVTTQPSQQAQSGVAILVQPRLQLQDVSGNIVTQAGFSIIAATVSGTGTLVNASAQTGVSGLAIFSGLTISGIVGNYTLRFTSGNLTLADADAVQLLAGAASKLVLLNQPGTTAQNGVALTTQPSVQLQDQAGNQVTQAGVVVVASTTSNTATVSNANATTNTMGVATWTTLALTGPLSTHTLRFAATNLQVVDAAAGTALSAGPAAKLTLSTQPGTSAVSGVALATQPVVQLRDAGNNAVSTAGIVVTATTVTGLGTMTNGTATTNANGIAMFSGLALSATAGNHTFRFSAPSLIPADAANATAITAGAATKLSLTTQPPTTAANGAALAPQPVVQIRDAGNNAVSQAGVVVTASTVSGTGVLANTTATTNASGVATFSGLSLTGTAGNYTFRFTAPALTQVDAAAATTLTAGAATKLVITTAPSASAFPGVALTTQPVVQLQDQSSNAVALAGTAVTAAVATGGGTLGGTSMVNTNANGAATFVDISIVGALGNRTLTFMSSGLTAATSGTIDVTVPPPVVAYLGNESIAGPATKYWLTVSNLAAYPQEMFDAAGALPNCGPTPNAARTWVHLYDKTGALLNTMCLLTTPAELDSLWFSKPTGDPQPDSVYVVFEDRQRVRSFASPKVSVSGTPLPFTLTVDGAGNGGGNISSNPAGIACTRNPTLTTGDCTENYAAGAVVLTATPAGGSTFTGWSGGGISCPGTGTCSVTMDAAKTVTATFMITKLAITTQPADTARSGVALARQPVIQLKDHTDANISEAGVFVTASIASGNGGISGTAMVSTNASGVATFTNLAITGDGPVTLQFTSPGRTSITSAAIILPTVLTNATPVAAAGATGSARWYVIDVPAAQTGLSVNLSGGTGDADLYVRQGALPTGAVYDCNSESGSNDEGCFFSNPVAGKWYVLVYGFATYSGAALTASYSDGSGCTLASPGDADNDRLPDCVETNTNIFVSNTNTGTSPSDSDTDNDGLKDGDEVLGSVGGLNLPGMGVSPLKRDILLEYDWFDDAVDCSAHSHQPTANSIAKVLAMFATAPGSNPDGTTGINVVQDYGQGGQFTGGTVISDADAVIAGGVSGADFLAYKAANFASNRNGYFHYVLMPHRYNMTSGSSGQAEIQGDDLIVSLYCANSDQNVANTIAHELGHNLNLRHGGNEDVNYKPNYNSVMNYQYQFPGIDNDCTLPGNGVLSYSIGIRPPLNENNVDEREGICGSGNGPGRDWNGDGDALDFGFPWDLNAAYGDGLFTTLTDWNDWANLFFLGINDGDGAFAGFALRSRLEIMSCPDVPAHLIRIR
jgi:hypothetical protein